MFERNDAPGRAGADDPQQTLPTVQPAGGYRSRQPTLHRCPNCGAINRGHASICPECGENLRTKPRRIRCRQCGKQASSVLVICPHCGRELVEAPIPWLRWLIPALILFLLVLFILSQWQALSPFGWVQAQIDSGLTVIDRLGANMDPNVVIESTPVALNSAVVSDSVAAPISTTASAIGGATAPVTVSQPVAVTSQAVLTTTEAAPPTPTSTASASATPTATAMPTATAAAAEPFTATATEAPTATVTETPTAPPTTTAAPSASATTAATPTRTATAAPTATEAPTATASPTTAPTDEAGATPTQTSASATHIAVRAAAVILLPTPTPTPLASSTFVTTTQFVRQPSLGVTTSATHQPTATSTATEPLTSTPPPTATPSLTPSPTPQVAYRVQPGDTLSGIAVRYAVSVDAIMAANGLSAQDVYALQPGDALLIPAENAPTDGAQPAPTNPPAPTTPPRTYTIQPGDIPIAIANRFGVSVDALLAANGLTREDARNLRTGQTLIIPTSEQPAAPAAAVAANPPASSAAQGAIRLDAPQLRSPENGADVSCSPGNSIAWLPVNFLRASDQYLMHLGFVNSVDDAGREQIVWVLEQMQNPGNTIWPMDVGLCSLAPQAFGRKWYWYVEVVETVNGLRQRVSPPSETWSFRWN